MENLFELKHEILDQNNSENPLIHDVLFTRKDWADFDQEPPVYIAEFVCGGTIESQAGSSLADNPDDYYGYRDVDAEVIFVNFYKAVNDDFVRGEQIASFDMTKRDHYNTIYSMFDNDMILVSEEACKDSLEGLDLPSGSYSDDDF